MRIPKRFQCFDAVIDVERDKDNSLQLLRDSVGMSYYQLNKISLAEPSVSITEEYIEKVFCHELTHMILHTIGETKLCDDERLVDLIGRGIRQFIDTAEYD